MNEPFAVACPDPSSSRRDVLVVAVSEDGAVRVDPGPGFGDEHADLAEDARAAVRRVVRGYVDDEGLAAGT